MAPCGLLHEMVDELAGSRLAPTWLRERALATLGYTEVHRAPLPDGSLRVLARGTVRHLRFGDAWEDQSAVDLADPGRPVLPYTAIAATAVGLPRRVGAVLHLGLGGGALVHVVRAVVPEARQMAVEPYEAVVDAARRYFALPAEVEVLVADAADAIQGLSREWDLVFLDTFSPVGEPVCRDERTYARVRRLLRDGGWLVVNVTGDPEASLAALRRTFVTVTARQVPRAEQWVVFASDTFAPP